MATRKPRVAKLVPHYHVPKDRCKVDTAKETQCKNSASFVATSGLNGSTETVPACKPHADILLLEGWKVRSVRASVVTF
jgi:hypothetical protein